MRRERGMSEQNLDVNPEPKRSVNGIGSKSPKLEIVGGKDARALAGMQRTDAREERLQKAEAISDGLKDKAKEERRSFGIGDVLNEDKVAQLKREAEAVYDDIVSNVVKEKFPKFFRQRKDRDFYEQELGQGFKKINERVFNRLDIDLAIEYNGETDNVVDFGKEKRKVEQAKIRKKASSLFESGAITKDEEVKARSGALTNRVRDLSTYGGVLEHVKFLFFDYIKETFTGLLKENNKTKISGEVTQQELAQALGNLPPKGEEAKVIDLEDNDEGTPPFAA
jgi:hypothetical protein